MAYPSGEQDPTDSGDLGDSYVPDGINPRCISDDDITRDYRLDWGPTGQNRSTWPSDKPDGDSESLGGLY